MTTQSLALPRASVQMDERRRVGATRALQYAFATTDDALDANREGRLSSKQLPRLVAKLLRPTVIPCLILITCFASWAVYAGSLDRSTAPQFLSAVGAGITHPALLWAPQAVSDSNQSIPLLTVTVLAFYLLVAFVLFRLPWGLTVDLLLRRVDSVTGRVTGEHTERGGNGVVRHYYVMKDDMRFEVNQAACSAIDDGGTYTIHYLRYSRIPLSVEPVSRPIEARNPQQWPK